MPVSVAPFFHVPRVLVVTKPGNGHKGQGALLVLLMAGGTRETRSYYKRNGARMGEDRLTASTSKLGTLTASRPALTSSMDLFIPPT